MDEYLAARCAAFDENYKSVLQRFCAAAEKSGRAPSEITLLAATKTVESEVINHAHAAGIEVMGENRVQEFLSKEQQLDSTLRRQFIGTLQRNKVHQIVGRVELIQSVDSLRLAHEIDRQSERQGIVSNVLIEVNIAEEQSKSGILPEQLSELLGVAGELRHISVQGLMTLGPIGQSVQKKLNIFDKMQKLFIDNKAILVDNINMNVLSMGMSDDFDIAIECGANMVRVGSALFGARNYN